jgi:hypothetical protein
MILDFTPSRQVSVMNRFVFALIVCLFLEGAMALTVEEMNVSYQAKILSINDVRDESARSLREKYQVALKRYREGFQKAGDLKNALKIQEESDAISKKTWPLQPLPDGLKRKVGKARGIYVKNYVAIERKWAVETSDAADKMVELLDGKKVELTKSGDLEGAQKVKAKLDAIQNDPQIIRARELPNRITENGRSKAAYIIRRGGDNLEVLVRYDQSGKVSLKSPVENVVEQTGGRREKGKTNAKTLGEFVGAEGCDSFPFLSYNEEAKDGKLIFAHLSGVIFEKQRQFKDEEAVGIKIQPNVKNASFGLPGVLTDGSSPATYRISFEYLIPSTNAKVVGLTLQQGASAGKTLKKTEQGKGSWVAGVYEVASVAPFDFLTIYFQGPTTKTFPGAAGDEVLFKNFKVEHIRFSAFVVEAYDETGGAIEQETNISSQKFLINNGDLISE